jgi:anti-sigma factor RsiW
MNDSVYDELLRLGMKRELTADDRAKIEAGLAAHPELRARWDEDAALNRALRATADAPVSSNFTSRVMDAIDFADREAPAPVAWWRRFVPQWKPQAGWAAALAALLLAGAWQYQQRQKITVAREDVREISTDIASLVPTSPEVFKDFDAINQLRYVSTVSDDELLKVLNQ